MEYAVLGDIDAFIRTGLYTFAIAAALAIGMLVVSSPVRLVRNWKNRKEGIRLP